MRVYIIGVRKHRACAIFERKKTRFFSQRFFFWFLRIDDEMDSIALRKKFGIKIKRVIKTTLVLIIQMGRLN